MSVSRSIAAASFLLVLGGCGQDLAPLTPAPDPCDDGSTDWPMMGGGICNRRFAAHETKISASNAKSLAVKWVYDAAGDVSATPSVIGANLYIVDWGGEIAKLDAETGAPIWKHAVGDLAGYVDEKNKPLAGLYARTTPIVVGQNLVFGTQRNVPQIISDVRPSAFMIAIDKDTAEVKWKTALHGGHPAAVITGSPSYDGDRIYVGVSSLEEAFGAYVPNYQCCTFRGSVVALDAKSGAVIWQTPMIDDARYFTTGPDGKQTPSGYSGAAVWSSTPVVDRARKQLYITTGNNYTVPSGVVGLEDGNDADAIMALDLDTGAVKWSRSLVDKPDVWTFKDMSGPDSDFGCGANLLRGDGKDLVGAGQKSGVYYALDPDTGALVWKTRVGPTGHLGGIHWGTATDGDRIYAGVNDENGTEYVVGGSGKHGGETTKVGSWAALDPKTGAILWQTPNPEGGKGEMGSDVNAPVTVANGVVFGGSMDLDGTMFALDAKTGDVLWSFKSGGTVYGGAAIVGGVVYWGSGYQKGRLGFGTTSKKLYAFTPQ